MEFKKDCDFWQLREECWCCDWVFEKIIEENKIEEFMMLLEEIFCEVPTITELNDFIRFENDYIFEQLNIPND